MIGFDGMESCFVRFGVCFIRSSENSLQISNKIRVHGPPVNNFLATIFQSGNYTNITCINICKTIVFIYERTCLSNFWNAHLYHHIWCIPSRICNDLRNDIIFLMKKIIIIAHNCCVFLMNFFWWRSFGIRILAIYKYRPREL